MGIIKIELDKPVQEFEIGGKVYEVNYDDESLKKYEEQAKTFYDKTRKKVDLEKAKQSDIEKHEQELVSLLSETIECFFGEGSYKEIYQATGKSLINLVKVVNELVKWLNSKMTLKDQNIKQYYTK